MALFIKVMLTEFVAEMGDKTQLMLVALTSKFKLRDIILGTLFAIFVLNGIAVLAGGLIGTLIPDWLIKIIAALAFIYFAITSLISDDDDEEEGNGNSKIKFAPIAVFCTFFVAELGDKTQLTAMTFGANEGLSNALVVWIACSIGLFAADIIGMLIGYFMKSKMPEGILNIIAFFIFSVFGIMTLRQGLKMLMPINSDIRPDIITAVVATIFVIICIVIYLRQSKKVSNSK